ncbi:hypothetical protein SAMN04489732_103490 [Amycolatopsis saalfeldensis]|uniref:Uncharacterized protein n=1 Tax=Amycolatopsis saalfeldensis TaxID=394193 RepID=A0A1H8UVJ8_9PSEU|nr:hypothetical protein SAMN04489732_103490 [Amycolatopsis saalfeldensis]
MGRRIVVGDARDVGQPVDPRPGHGHDPLDPGRVGDVRDHGDEVAGSGFGGEGVQAVGGEIGRDHPAGAAVSIRVPGA